MASSSSFSSYFLLLCLSMYLSVSTLGKSIHFDYPQPPAPESEDDGGFDFEFDNDYPQPPAPESGEGADYGYGNDNDYPQPPAPALEPESGEGDDCEYTNDVDLDYNDNTTVAVAKDYCPDVVTRMTTCQEYLNGHDDLPTPTCCDNLEILEHVARQVGYRNMCNCLEDLQASFLHRPRSDNIFQKFSSVGWAWMEDYFNPDEYISPAEGEETPAACDYVNRYFPACQDYLDGSVDFPRKACCSNLLILRGITYEVGPRKICQCIEDLKMTFLESRIKLVYEKCEIHLNFPISEHMDCSSVE